MRKEKHAGSLSKEKDKKEKSVSVTRAFSWLSGSTLSRQTRKLFRSHNDLNTLSHTAQRDQEKGDDDWVYEPQHYIGKDSVFIAQELKSKFIVAQLYFSAVEPFCFWWQGRCLFF